MQLSRQAPLRCANAPADRAAGSRPGPPEQRAAGSPQGPPPEQAIAERLEAGGALAALAAGVAADLHASGVCFHSVDGERDFVVDPVPRIIEAADWAPLAAGLAQRARALESFVADVYGERRIVAAGIVPEWEIESAEMFEPELAALGVAPRRWAPVAGLDVVLDREGSFLVLEDNLRTPSGLAYAIAVRDVLARRLPPPEGMRVRSIAGGFELLGAALRATAPKDAGPEPVVVLLSDGERNSAFYEHGVLARALGIPLVLLDQLSVRGERLVARVEGRELHVDVLYRRSDEDRLFEPGGRPTAVAALVLEPWAAGTLGVANAFGTGVADDKLLHAYVEEMVRFYLDAEPLLRSVPTYDLSDPATLEMVLERIGELVIKPRTGHGGVGVLVAPHARTEDVTRVAEAISARPEQYVAQEMIMLSRHPTVSHGRLQPRHADLRPFVFSSGEDVSVLPGGLTRVALDAGALVVNSSQSGGAKDTWVLE